MDTVATRSRVVHCFNLVLTGGPNPPAFFILREQRRADAGRLNFSER